MNTSMLNEALAAVFCLLISWSFGIWFYHEWRNNELNRKGPFAVAFAVLLALLVTVGGSVLPVYFVAKCYFHYVLRHLSPETVSEITIGDTVITKDIAPIITALNNSEWFVPNEQAGWSKLVREGGVPIVIKEKDGQTYKFTAGYYFLGETLVKFPTGGYAMSRNLSKAMDDVGAPLP
ncbi:MAG: hypothetical protein C5B53_00760 [Candidatus Melainabacteria bacterium]|nr:MAG: hypothetical protein C5B53_00760 [Candidatus Melainabacteria bacterium]